MSLGYVGALSTKHFVIERAECVASLTRTRDRNVREIRTILRNHHKRTISDVYITCIFCRQCKASCSDHQMKEARPSRNNASNIRHSKTHINPTHGANNNPCNGVWCIPIPTMHVQYDKFGPGMTWYKLGSD